MWNIQILGPYVITIEHNANKIRLGISELRSTQAAGIKRAILMSILNAEEYSYEDFHTNAVKELTKLDPDYTENNITDILTMNRNQLIRVYQKLKENKHG